MDMIYSPENLPQSGQPLAARIGGKGKALFELHNAGFPVPYTLCIGSDGYDYFVEYNNLREKINLELHWKEIKEMRWEEIWDISLRIQNLFLEGTIPDDLSSQIRKMVQLHFSDKSIAIRSSAPEEDSAVHSFAGLHESYLNVTGGDELLKKVKKVWASLWSDRAILYRQELGLEVASSNMAVVIQEFVEGDRSGIVFSRSPLDETQIIVEAVYGLNQGLVDGAVEPDRWVIDREGRTPPLHHSPTERDYQFIRSGTIGVQRQQVSHAVKIVPPLNSALLKQLTGLALKLENYFGIAQDVEWTIVNNVFHILQSRPVTAKSSEASSDKRSWYLSLNRSYDNLLQLWERISLELLPEMDLQSEQLANISLDDVSMSELAEELRHRTSINDKWTAIYWSDFIPFAHGVRLFGEMYNDVIEPNDPFEFVSLLTGQEMLSTDRNSILHECGQMVREDNSLRLFLEDGRFDLITNEVFSHKVSQLKDQFSMAWLGTGDKEMTNGLISAMILQYGAAGTITQAHASDDVRSLETRFIERGREKLQVDPLKLLEMARASYRIRDDDNIHIGRIAQQLERAKAHARERLGTEGIFTDTHISSEELSILLKGGRIDSTPAKHITASVREGVRRVKARQLKGQAASTGIAKGRARVISNPIELKEFIHGEVLVIDSIDPTMTFFAPLAAGIIERRGGMLIHGAIIAREYGIPCITGVVDATSYISTGDVVTVDGYLGICTVQRS